MERLCAQLYSAASLLPGVVEGPWDSAAEDIFQIPSCRGRALQALALGGWGTSENPFGWAKSAVGEEAGPA